MGNTNVSYYFEESQDFINLELESKKCILCDGVHGNNSWCQAPYYLGSE